jgi:hypothetical protein
MADVQIAIRLRRKASDDTAAVFAISNVLLDDGPNKI